MPAKLMLPVRKEACSWCSGRKFRPYQRREKRFRQRPRRRRGHFPAVEFLPQVQLVVQQEAHHRAVTFQEDYRRLLESQGIEFDERYLWD